jgi:hypothetical protein
MFPERSPENNVCRVAPFLFSQYIARMLWRVRNSRGRPKNAPAAFIHSCRPKVRRSAALVLIPTMKFTVILKSPARGPFFTCGSP